MQRSVAHQQHLSRSALYPVDFAKLSTQKRCQGTSFRTTTAGYWTRQRSCTLRQARCHGDHASSEMFYSAAQEVVKQSPHYLGGQQYGADAALLNTRGTTPLHLAAKQGNIQTAKSLLCNGADINAQEVQEEALDSWGWTPLHYAAWHNKIQMVELLLSHGASVDATDSEGATPLALAACTNRTALTELLMLRGANPAPLVAANLVWGTYNDDTHPLDKCVKEGWTPLHYAVHHNRSKMALLLIAHGASPDDTPHVDSPLTIAIRAGNLHMVKLLWEHRSNKKHENWWPSTEYEYLATAVSENQIDIVEHMLRIGVDAAERARNGGSHILSAVWDSIPHLLNMQNILRTKELDQCDNAWAVADLDDDSDSDSDVDSAHDSDSDSEFLLPQERVPAGNAKRLRIMQLLLLHGADVHACQPRRKGTGPSWHEFGYDFQPGQTALHLAAQNRAPAIVQLLLTHGADPKARTPEGRTPLHHAAFTNDLETIKLLLHHGVNASATDYQGQTAMHSAATQDDDKSYTRITQVRGRSNLVSRFEPPVNLDYQQAVETLLAHGADLSAQDNQGLTTLHCAARDGNVEMVQALLSSGADVHAKDCLGWTALHCAVYNRSEAIANMLLVAGASVNLQDDEGCTPLHLCVYPTKHTDRHGQWVGEQTEHADLAVFLLNHGADPSIKNQQGEMPVDPAVVCDDPERTNPFKANTDLPQT